MSKAVLQALDSLAARGQQARLWWRDDDAVLPSAPLETLLRLCADWDVPVTLAVIPQPTGTALATRLGRENRVTVALHGWSHADHAAGVGKKQELGPQRPPAVVLGELAAGLAKLRDLHGARLAPVLVPPWNRISADLLPDLPGIGIAALSVYGPAKAAPLPVINTHVDLMDWHGTGRGHPTERLMADLAAALLETPAEPIGILSHHLVHDAQAWRFLDQLFALTRHHPGCHWVALPKLLLQD